MIRITEYSNRTKSHFAELKDYIESLIQEFDFSNKFGNIRSTKVTLLEQPEGSKATIDFTFSKSSTLSLERVVLGTKITWSCQESTFLGLVNLISHDEMLEKLTLRLFLSMIEDFPQESRLAIKHTSTKLSR